MTPGPSTSLIGEAVRLPAPRSPEDRRTDATVRALDVQECELYGHDVTAAPTPWVAYVSDAVERAGGVAELARRAKRNGSTLNASTIFRWRNGETSPGRATIDNVIAVARAIGDDPDNALRAAGQLPADDTSADTAADTGRPRPTLADRLREIREAPLMSLDEKIRAAAELIALYTRPPVTDAGQPGSNVSDAEGREPPNLWSA
jgi:hypothetical protein